MILVKLPGLSETQVPHLGTVVLMLAVWCPGRIARGDLCGAPGTVSGTD